MTASTRKAPGFTLLEMMVAMAILGIALSSAMYIVVGVNTSAERVRRVGETQDTARLALDSLAAEIRMSGAGASSGQIGIGTTAPAVTRIPTIYSGPDVTVTTAGGQQVVTNSIYIISAEPGAGAPSSDGAGMLGSVISSGIDPATGIQIECTDQRGVQVDCTAASFQGNTILPTLPSGGLTPLLVGDYVNAVYLRPTNVAGVANGSQAMKFAEMAIPGAYSPDPKAPFGFAKGASLGKARVTHWYLKQVNPGDWELMRSHPILDDTWSLAGGCNTTSPFVDETSSADRAAACAAGGPGAPSYCGQVVGSGPVENLQIRYVVDNLVKDDPTMFHVWGDGTNGGAGYHMGLCDSLNDGSPVQHVLREVRVSVVARSRMPDHASNATTKVKRYGLAGWEGVSPTGGALDEFPRRTFEARIVPRNLQGILRL